jgi:hypothetical protein
MARLDAVEARLETHAASATPTGLTDPDPPTGERWEAGQVWAHVAEFVAYWQRQAEVVLNAPDGEVAAFGRTKEDAQRIEAIERDRRHSPMELMDRVTQGLAALRAFLLGLPPEAWDRVGTHPTRGEMPVGTIIETFEVAHLEEHVGQLDGLSEAAPSV